MEIWQAFQSGGMIGKLVLMTLLVFSIASWATIILLWYRFNRAFTASKRFLQVFRQSRRLVDVQNASVGAASSPLVGLFRAGYAEIESQMSDATTGQRRLVSLSTVERALIRATRIESARLIRALPFLATTAAATPFIGLFGTVWGIMVSFSAIGTAGTTSIVAVAPGISEALINTAAGLFAAIPALISYNHFNARLRRARGEMDDFSLEFLNLAERNFM